MTARIAFEAASGFGLHDFHLLTTRGDPRGGPDAGVEVMLVEAKDGRLRGVQLGGEAQDLWRAPGGAVYMATFGEVVWSDDPTPGGGPWHEEPLPGGVARVTGVGADLVFVYGSMMGGPIHRRDGGRWVADPSPGRVLRIHGASPSLVYGVGVGGLIARWDGSSWTAVPTSVAGVFRDVHIASEDQMYAVHETGLWEGSVHGWAQRLTAPKGTVRSVAVWRDQVWVGTTDRGLCVLEGSELVTVKDNQSPSEIDARGDLLLAQGDKVAATSDGEKYRAWKLGSLAKLWDQQPPPPWA